VTGKKRTQKVYRRHSGRPGGMKMESFAQLQARYQNGLLNTQSRVCCQKIVWGGNCSPSLKFMLEPIIPPSPKPQELKIQTIPGEPNNKQ